MGDEVYVLESKTELASSQSRDATCSHSVAAFRIVTLTTPAFIVATATTEGLIRLDWSALDAAAAPGVFERPGLAARCFSSSFRVHGGGRHLLQGPVGLMHGHWRTGMQSVGVEALAAQVAAHESIVVHALRRCGGYLRLFGYSSASPAHLVVAGFVAGLVFLHGLVLPAAICMLLWCLVHFHAAVRCDPHHVGHVLEETEANLAASAQLFAELGTALAGVASVLMWRRQLYTWVTLFGLLAGSGLLLGQRYTRGDLLALARMYGPVAMAALTYYLLSAWWGREVMDWMQHARELEHTLRSRAAPPPGSPPGLDDTTPQGLLRHADALRDENRRAEDILAFMTSALPQGVPPVEWAWRVARAHSDMCLDSTDPAAVRTHTQKGLEALRPFLTQDPPCGHVFLWQGILLTQEMLLVPLKDKLAYVYRIRDALQRAADVDPTLALAHHALGEWHWIAADLGWVEKQAVRAFFGEVPSVTLEQCRAFFQRAAELDPQFTSTCLRLGQCYSAMRQPREARVWLERALQCRALGPRDRKAQADAAACLRKL